MSSLYEFDADRVAGSGNFSIGTAGENLGDRKVVYMGIDGGWYLADADTIAEMSVLGLTMHPIAVGFNGWILLKGFIGLPAWTWTVGGEIYASTTVGELTQTPPTGVGDTIQVVATATQTTQIYFDPKGSGAGTGCAVLEGATAYVGFDGCKEPYANYFLCDGVEDEVQWQQAVDYLDGVETGLLFGERGLYSFNDTLTVDVPIYIRGVGAGWHGTARPTCINTAAGLAGKDVIEFVAGSRQHFGGISDLSIYNTTGVNAIYVESISDVHFERIYINHSALNGIYVNCDEFDMWHFWIKDCWIENCSGAGLRVDPADHSWAKIHILDNCFYACDLGVIIQRAVASGGQARHITIRGNEFFQTGKTGCQLWKVCNHVDISHNIFYDCGQDAGNTYHAIRIGDGDAPADKCQWINIVGNIIDGGGTTKWGISLEDSTDRVMVLGNTIHGCATAPYNAEVGVTNVEKAHNIEV